MNKIFFFSAVLVLFFATNTIAQEVNQVEAFDKITLSPHVEAVITKGDKESVTILNSTVERGKVHIQVKNKILRVYLEGAKEYTKNEKVNENGRDIKKSIYNGTVLKIAVSYKTLETLSIRGGETIQIKGKVNQDNFDLAIYGESEVVFDDVQLKNMQTAIYGESTLEIKAGNVNNQKFTIYGEAKVNALAVKNNITRATLYGEAELKVNTAEQIRVTSFGEAKLNYKGNPEIKKGIAIGKVQISKID